MNHLFTKPFVSLLFCIMFVGIPAQAQKTDSPQLKDLNGFFPFDVPGSLADWEKRSNKIRRQVLVANNLWPMPERTPLNAMVHGKIERPGFTVEKVYFESIPGFHVTGLLFRPSDTKEGAKLPAVLSPHGHGGRLMDLGADRILKEIKEGGEKFADSGRFPKVARCATLARMGCVTLLYDMIGYADNQQLSRQLGHGFAKQRPDFEGSESWGLYSAQAEMRLQSIFGLQTWNSIRALDFLESLPDVDPKRIAVTGGSGGGTQTIMICAIDSRPIAAFPNGMVSSSMQGGCTCENASLLRIGTGNVELAALFAPKPQGMTSANDWTKEMLVPGKGFPELKKLYTLYGKQENVICADLTRFPHNYNYVTRKIMYEWFNKHLKLGLDEPIVEKDFARLTSEEHAVYDKSHPRPVGGETFERGITKWLAEKSDKQLAALTPEKRRETVLLAWKTILDIEDAGSLKMDFPIEKIAAEKADDSVTIWIDGKGKAAVLSSQGAKAGISVFTADLISTGITETATVANKREFAGYTHGYNHSLFAQRVQQVVAMINHAKSLGKKIQLKASNGAEPVVIAACAVAGKGAVAELILENDQFRFADIKSYRDPNFAPGAVKYGDLPGLLDLVKENGTTVQAMKR